MIGQNFGVGVVNASPLAQNINQLSCYEQVRVHLSEHYRLAIHSGKQIFGQTGKTVNLQIVATIFPPPPLQIRSPELFFFSSKKLCDVLVFCTHVSRDV